MKMFECNWAVIVEMRCWGVFSFSYILLSSFSLPAGTLDFVKDFNLICQCCLSHLKFVFQTQEVKDIGLQILGHFFLRL